MARGPLLAKSSCSLLDCHVTGFPFHHHHPPSTSTAVTADNNQRPFRATKVSNPTHIHPLSLPDHQTGQDPAATSPMLTSTNKPDDERPAPNAHLPPHHPLTATSPGSTNASKLNDKRPPPPTRLLPHHRVQRAPAGDTTTHHQQRRTPTATVDATSLGLKYARHVTSIHEPHHHHECCKNSIDRTEHP